MAWHIAGAQHMFAVIIVSLIKNMRENQVSQKIFSPTQNLDSSEGTRITS